MAQALEHGMEQDSILGGFPEAVWEEFLWLISRFLLPDGVADPCMVAFIDNLSFSLSSYTGSMPIQLPHHCPSPTSRP